MARASAKLACHVANDAGVLLQGEFALRWLVNANRRYFIDYYPIDVLLQCRTNQVNFLYQKTQRLCRRVSSI